MRRISQDLFTWVIRFLSLFLLSNRNFDLVLKTTLSQILFFWYLIDTLRDTLLTVWRLSFGFTYTTSESLAWCSFVRSVVVPDQSVLQSLIQSINWIPTSFESLPGTKQVYLSSYKLWSWETEVSVTKKVMECSEVPFSLITLQ